MKTTKNIITGTNLFVYQVKFEDETITQYASIYNSSDKHPGICDNKGKKAIELISLGFKNQKDILIHFPNHKIIRFNNGNSITRELFAK